MDRYWSYIATPLFFIVIGFGLFTLFTTNDVQLVNTKDITTTVDMIRSGASAAKAAKVATPASVAAPAAVAGTPSSRTPPTPPPRKSSRT